LSENDIIIRDTTFKSQQMAAFWNYIFTFNAAKGKLEGRWIVTVFF
jgi:hypothetical protein